MRLTLLFSVCVVARVALAAEPAPESHALDLDGIKIHYTNYGAGDTALVLVHGWACDETVWQGQLPLATTIRLITVDLPGHGQSDKPQIAYTMDLYAAALDAVLGDAKVDRAILVGHSNGTPVIRQFYRKYPEKVAALVIVDGSLRPLAEAEELKKFLAPFRENYNEQANRFLGFLTKPIENEGLREQIRTTILKTPPHVAISELENTADPELWKPDKIEVPVLMILAKQPAWTEDYEQFVRQLIPKLDYQMWENVSHFIMMQKPREFDTAVAKFLRENKFVSQE